jgi:hypothetical protein
MWRKSEGSRCLCDKELKKSYHLLLQLIPLLGHRPALCSQLYFHLLAYKTEAYDCFTTVGVLKYKKSGMIKPYKLHCLMEDPIMKNLNISNWASAYTSTAYALQRVFIELKQISIYTCFLSLLHMQTFDSTVGKKHFFGKITWRRRACSPAEPGWGARW